jgi:hypothetical protein
MQGIRYKYKLIIAYMFDTEEELLHLNSTILRTKQERNLRESNLRCVHLGAPPLIYIGVTMGCLGWQFNSYQLEPTLGANGEVTR